MRIVQPAQARLGTVGDPFMALIVERQPEILRLQQRPSAKAISHLLREEQSLIVLIPSTEAQKVPLDYFQADLLNRGHSDSLWRLHSIRRSHSLIAPTLIG